MELGTLERELHIDATPDVVFDVVSNPEHVREWWPDEAEYPVEPGGEGHIAFDGHPVRFTVVDAIPPKLFSFRWTHAEGETAAPGNSFLVVFELEPAGTGTRLRMTETGFRERGWDEAKIAAEYADHESGWDHFLPQIPAVTAKVGATS
ncbi:SRPBCC domain-containing protein [Amycolatopsis sp. SID8362]|uniref:SRPBCC domain-containing protein n=1 Tax=Amycolatopsis sp. SID8362 TaxID=2690346 RepID=UPI00136EEF09|nr:SRPBCC domain-containing protein [Amycolatopsis sp. SID8362]NBH05818.1 polyketide cyclase [Amycolatopsis sp. SID8362]NED42516.1 polyketide cyclase [Amycolatopsis sp. SID8362]